MLYGTKLLACEQICSKRHRVARHTPVTYAKLLPCSAQRSLVQAMPCHLLYRLICLRGGANDPKRSTLAFPKPEGCSSEIHATHSPLSHLLPDNNCGCRHMRLWSKLLSGSLQATAGTQTVAPAARPTEPSTAAQFIFCTSSKARSYLRRFRASAMVNQAQLPPRPKPATAATSAAICQCPAVDSAPPVA